MLLRFLLLACAFALGTWTFGWWAVPIIGAIWGLFARGSAGSGLTAGVAAALGWGALLGFDAVGGRLVPLLSRLAPMFALPGFVLLLVTLVLAAMLAWLAAGVTGALAAPRVRA